MMYVHCISIKQTNKMNVAVGQFPRIDSKNKTLNYIILIIQSFKGQIYEA